MQCCKRDREDTDSDVPQTAVTMPKALATTPLLSSASATALIKPKSASRSHDEAVLFASQRQFLPDSDKRLTLDILESLGLAPFAVLDAEGNEQNALAHPAIIRKLFVSGPLQSAVTVPNPTKRLKFMDGTSCESCSPMPVPGLDSVFALSTFSRILRTRTFVELDDQTCGILNEDWKFQRQYRYGCAQILAGCILLNTRNGQAIMVNALEVYGRTPMVDSHCESFGIKKGVPVQTSLPKPDLTHYKDVWPTTLGPGAESDRLVIGTQSFDALVTLSVRLDVSRQGSVGANTGTFSLRSDDDSRSTRIFLDKESLELGMALNQDKKVWRISNSNTQHQLRQLKTKFDDPSTYLLCRAWSPLTKDHSLQPCSVWTYCDHGQSGDGLQASILFHAISMAVLNEGNAAVLELSTVQRCRQGCSAHSNNIPSQIDSILDLFSADTTRIPILGNRQLSRHLEVLANHLSSYFKVPNENILQAVFHRFEC
ncbi:hypothetical protein BGZ99_005215 [Dissophora globulifera]|uniref:Uncharacterized protein n=1 Tax=Dissophora globulifera TaxID=979702 RepID=A0A9P6RFI3_9FUNG|nr:hypothetical protein BGZ99_005215 [Dissophora globulifera]